LHFQIASLSGLETKIFGASQASCSLLPCRQLGLAPVGLMPQTFVATSIGWRRTSIVSATASTQLIGISVRHGFGGGGARTERWLWGNRSSLIAGGKHEKPVGAMGCLPHARGFFELNPGAAATSACGREISWSSHFSVSGRRKGEQAEA